MLNDSQRQHPLHVNPQRTNADHCSLASSVKHLIAYSGSCALLDIGDPTISMSDTDFAFWRLLSIGEIVFIPIINHPHNTAQLSQVYRSAINILEDQHDFNVHIFEESICISIIWWG